MSEADDLFNEGDAAHVACDFKRAFKCFEQGAALGDDSCLSRLAYCYDEGFGVPADGAKAMSIYRDLWRRKRDQLAANNIAVLYRERGEYRTMFHWFLRAAAVGDGDAHVEIAKCYIVGQGVRRNPAAAQPYIAAALASKQIIEHSLDEAEDLLAGIIPVPNDRGMLQTRPFED